MAKQLTADQVDIVLRAARPLPPSDHAAFLEEVTTALAGCSELGDGLVSRTCREVQRRHWDPPEFSGNVAGPRIPKLR
jgi:hypothetical protein